MLVNQVRQNYVDSVTTARLVYGAIDGMLAALDPHSRFLRRDASSQLEAWRAGQLAGAGIVVEAVEGVPVVQAVLPRSPAARRGVAPGDRIALVNDSTVAGLGADAVQLMLVGERGRRSRLQLERGSRLEPETLSVELRFDVMRPEVVSAARTLPGGVGYVRVAEFLPGASQQVREAIRRALPDRGPRRLILDLRGNPGGEIVAAVDVASPFLTAGQLVFRTEGRRRGVGHEFRTEHDGELRDVAMVVLVDEQTASAAEAVAGSLQDHDRALTAGRRTFGKALMQRLLLVPPNDDVVWLTVGYVLTPSGRLIQRRYGGLSAAQYYAGAGHDAGERDTTTYRTDGGRPVHGGGGIRPDTILPSSPPPPRWFIVAADSGFDHAVADSVAHTLAASTEARESWMRAEADWQERLVVPFLRRVHERLGVTAPPDAAQAAHLGRLLARRAAVVRWGEDAGDELAVRNDPDIRAAVTLFPLLPSLLAGPPR